MTALERLTAALEGHGSHQQGRGRWQCPAHEDRNASLSVGEGDKRALVRCQAGCDTKDVVAVLGLTTADLFDEPRSNGSGLREVEAYPYVDEDGRGLYEVVRLDPKGFRQRRPDGRGGWIWKLGDTPRVLYRLPQVVEQARQGGTVYVCEGERDVHAIEKAGAVATTNPGGAGKWRDEYAAALRGADVRVVADRDEPGRAHAQNVAASLRGTAASVQIVEAAEGKDAADHLRAGRGLEEFRPVEADGAEPASPVQRALDESRVDLIELRRRGVPPRDFVPGARGWLAKGKRHHLAAVRKTGKSLGVGVVAAVDIVAAGGVVVVLDRENGADEYARRLDAVLTGRRASAACEERVRRNLRYHAWPTLKLEWGRHDSYPQAFAGTDLVIFDSSRKFLTSVQLKEDLSDDYSAFTEALIDPLSRAGTSTLILDNTGHGDQGRSRGSSAKGDLADVTFVMKELAPFSETRAGRLQLEVSESRFGDVEGRWTLDLGDGAYGTWQRPGGALPPAAREDLLALTRNVLIEADGALGVGKIKKAIRAIDGAPKFSNDKLEQALPAWAVDPASGIVHAGHNGGYQAAPGPQLRAQQSIPEGLRDGPVPRDGRDGPGWPPSGMAENPAGIGDQPIPAAAREGSGRPHPAAAPPYGGGTDGMTGGTGSANGDLPERLLAYIAGHQPATAKQIRDNVDGNPKDVLRALGKLDRNNRIRQFDGGWRVAG